MRSSCRSCGRRRDHPRQGHADRIRELPGDRHADRLQLARRFRIQSLRPARGPSHHASVQRRPSGAADRRLELRLGHRCQCEPGGDCDRHRDLGIDSEPRERERDRRHQADRGPGQPRRHHSHHRGSGHGGTPHANGDGRRDPVGRDRRIRSQRPGNGGVPDPWPLLQRLHAVLEPPRAEGRTYCGVLSADPARCQPPGDHRQRRGRTESARRIRTDPCRVRHSAAARLLRRLPAAPDSAAARRAVLVRAPLRVQARPERVPGGHTGRAERHARRDRRLQQRLSCRR